jgi:hypothetical protein
MSLNIIIINLIGHNTGSVESGKKYRPLFLDHFDKKESPEVEKVS